MSPLNGNENYESLLARDLRTKTTIRAHATVPRHCLSRRPQLIYTPKDAQEGRVSTTSPLLSLSRGGDEDLNNNNNNNALLSSGANE